MLFLILILFIFYIYGPGFTLLFAADRILFLRRIWIIKNEQWLERIKCMIQGVIITGHLSEYFSAVNNAKWPLRMVMEYQQDGGDFGAIVNAHSGEIGQSHA